MRTKTTVRPTRVPPRFVPRKCVTRRHSESRLEQSSGTGPAVQVQMSLPGEDAPSHLSVQPRCSPKCLAKECFAEICGGHQLEHRVTELGVADSPFCECSSPCLHADDLVRRDVVVS